MGFTDKRLEDRNTLYYFLAFDSALAKYNVTDVCWEFAMCQISG